MVRGAFQPGPPKLGKKTEQISLRLPGMKNSYRTQKRSGEKGNLVGVNLADNTECEFGYSAMKTSFTQPKPMSEFLRAIDGRKS